MIQFKNKKASQWLLEASLYSKDIGVFVDTSDPNPNPLPIRGFKNRPLLIELEYFKSFLKRKEFTNHFHFGYILNANLNRENYIPFATNQFQTTSTCLCVGAGIKAMYAFPLSKKMILTISSDINLIDLGLGINYNANPNIFADLQRSTEFGLNLFRKRFGIDIGIAF